VGSWREITKGTSAFGGTKAKREITGRPAARGSLAAEQQHGPCRAGECLAHSLCVLAQPWADHALRLFDRLGHEALILFGRLLLGGQRASARSGSVTDLYLPRWFAHNMPAIHAPLIVLITCLHAQNLRRRAAAHQTG